MKLVILVDSVQFFRDVLRTPLLSRLLEQPADHVILASIFDPSELAKEFSHPRLKVVPLTARPRSWAQRILLSLGRDLYCVEHPEGSFAQKRSGIVAEHNRWSVGVRAFLAKGLWTCGLRTHHTIAWSTLLGTDPEFARLLDAERPDAVVYSFMIPAGYEALKEARRRGIPICLMVASWDNPTSKGPMAVVPDRVLVWSEQMRREMTEFHRVPGPCISTTGVLYFDQYFSPQKLQTRAEFCRTMSIPENCRILHFATGDSAIMKCNGAFIRILHRIVESGELGMPCHLLVRVSPKDLYDLYKEFEGLPNLTVQYPKGKGAVYGGHRWIPEKGEENERASTIKNSDIILSVSSSMVLDASCFDVPTVNLAYDAGMPVRPWESVERFYQYTHAQPVLEEEATYVVRSDAELVAALKLALSQPQDKAGQRRSLLRRLVQFTDGRSDERVAAELRRLASGSQPPTGFTSQKPALAGQNAH